MPSAAKNRPMSAPRRLGPLGQVGDDHAPVHDEQQDDRDDRRPGPPEREPEPRGEPRATDARRDRSRPEPDPEPERPDPDEGQADDDDAAVITSATPWSDVADRTASDSGGIATSVRLWALPMKARPKPRRAGPVRCGTRDSAAGSVPAMPIPWKIRATMNGPAGPPGSTPGRSRIGAPDEIGEPADREHPQPAHPIDDDAGQERGRDLDERRDARRSSPISGSDTPARASATGSDAVNPWNPAWTANSAKASRSTRPSSGHAGRRRRRRAMRRS